MDTTHSDTAGREIITERSFNYPREAVFDAWTDPARIAVWWGPHGFTTTVHEMDVRPGGVWKFTMHGPDGTDYPNQVAYIEVAKPVRLEYRHGDGLNPDGDFHVTVAFTEQGQATHVSLRTVFASVEVLEQARKFGAEEGARQTLERLDAHLAAGGGPEVNIADLDV